MYNQKKKKNQNAKLNAAKENTNLQTDNKTYTIPYINKSHTVFYINVIKTKIKNIKIIIAHFLTYWSIATNKQNQFIS